MSLADQIIDGGPTTQDYLIGPDFAGPLRWLRAAELNALRDELLELRQLRAVAEALGRYEVSVNFWDDEAALTCRNCTAWRLWITDATTPLAELVRRAGEHTEDCP